MIFLDWKRADAFLPTQHLYLHTWAEELEKEHFRPGIYCSGIPVDEGGGSQIITADDIRAHIADESVVYWVYNDACPPSPGAGQGRTSPRQRRAALLTRRSGNLPGPAEEKRSPGIARGYANDGNCYAPGDAKHLWFLDVNVATTANPSAPR